MELRLHAAENIRVDFLALRTHDDRGLRPDDRWSLNRKSGTIRNLLADAGEAALTGRRTFADLIVVCITNC
ncbi:hypothetical protein [Burkholderia sp. F1]|uniref:hypothetical protein n=1 Tax=Burkholderia sp. F1 TaxID=3366817 RepID=UPI003D722B74